MHSVYLADSVKMEAKGQSAVGHHAFSVQLTTKRIIFEIVYAIWRLDKLAILHYDEYKMPCKHIQTYQSPTQLITFAKLGLTIDLVAQLPCVEA